MTYAYKYGWQKWYIGEAYSSHVGPRSSYYACIQRARQLGAQLAAEKSGVNLGVAA